MKAQNARTSRRTAAMKKTGIAFVVLAIILCAVQWVAGECPEDRLHACCWCRVAIGGVIRRPFQKPNGQRMTPPIRRACGGGKEDGESRTNCDALGAHQRTARLGRRPLQGEKQIPRSARDDVAMGQDDDEKLFSVRRRSV